MCCLFASLLMAGPRFAMLIWWLMDPVRWGMAFDTFLGPAFGFMLFPFTTLAYVAVFPGGVNGFDIVWLAIAVLLDLSSTFGGAYTNKDRMQGAY